MPQMMPINWIISFIIFILIFIMFNILNFYIYNINKNIIYKKSSNKKMFNSLNWKW